MPDLTLACPTEWGDPSMIIPGDSHAATHPSAPDVAAPAPEPDCWEQRGNCAPRKKLFRPTDDVMNMPIPVDQLDVTRDFETTSTFEGEGVFRDVWDGVSAADHRELGEPWTGLVPRGLA
eukprot:4904171-Pyramimonas_sp.AAC.1